MKLRIFKEGDRASVIALWKACDLTRPWNDPDKDISRKLSVQPELFLVGELDGQIMASAMAGFDGHRGSVYYLAVAPSYQHHGYGRILMADIEQRLSAIGCPKINLSVRNSNLDVLAFYESLGYATGEVVSIGKRLIPDS